MENRVDTSLFKKSATGINVDSPEEDLEVKFYYSKTSWFFITFFGTTRMPYRIDFIDRKSGEVFDSVSDKKRIEHYMRFRRR